MGRSKEVDDPAYISGYIERQDCEQFQKIALREYAGDKSKLLRKVIGEFNKAHAEGNDTFKLDNWHEDPNFQAVPTFLSNREKWKQHYENSNEKDRTQLKEKNMELTKLFRQVDINENRKGGIN